MIFTNRGLTFFRPRFFSKGFDFWLSVLPRYVFLLAVCVADVFCPTCCCFCRSCLKTGVFSQYGFVLPFVFYKRLKFLCRFFDLEVLGRSNSKKVPTCSIEVDVGGYLYLLNYVLYSKIT